MMDEATFSKISDVRRRMRDAQLLRERLTTARAKYAMGEFEHDDLQILVDNIPESMVGTFIAAFTQVEQQLEREAARLEIEFAAL